MPPTPEPRGNNRGKEQKLPSVLSSFSFPIFLSQNQRAHLENFAQLMEARGEEGKEFFQDLLRVIESLFTSLSERFSLRGEEEKRQLLSLLLSWFRSRTVPKTGEGKLMEPNFYLQLIEDSLNEYLGEKEGEDLSSLLREGRVPSLSQLVERHNRKKKVHLEAKYENDVGEVLLENLSYTDKEGKTHDKVSLIRAKEEGHLIRATKYASESSHVCIGDEGQSYREKLNKPTEQNGIEVYFLWEDDGSEGGRYFQILTYSKKSKRIEQMKGYDNHMISNETEYLPALWRALSFLREKREIKSVADTGKYRLPKGKVLVITEDGTAEEKAFSQLSEDDFVIKGEVKLSPEMSLKEIKKALMTRGMKVEIPEDFLASAPRELLHLLSEAKADISLSSSSFRVPEHISPEKAGILARIEGLKLIFKTKQSLDSFFHEGIQEVRGYIRASAITSEISLPYLEKVGGHLDAEKAKSFSAPNLGEVGGFLDAQNVESFSAPNLEKIVWSLNARNAESFSAPNLEKVGKNLNAQNAKNFSAPNLREVGKNLNARNAESFSAPNLEKVGGSLYAGNAESFSAPNLREVEGDLYAQNAKSFSAPNLEKVRLSLDAWSAESFSAPNLREVGLNLSAQNAKSFSAPNLEKVGWYLNAWSAESFSAPNLREVEGDLYARNAESFSAPQLREVGRILFSKSKFARYFSPDGSFDFDRAEQDGVLVIPKEMRKKIEWKE